MPAPYDVTLTVNMADMFWVDAGIVLNEGEQVYVICTGTGFVQAHGSGNGHDLTVTPVGATPSIPISGDDYVYGGVAGLPEIPPPVTVSYHCMVIASYTHNLGQPPRRITYGHCPMPAPYVHTAHDIEGLNRPQRVFFQWNNFGNYAEDYSGFATIRVVSSLATPAPVLSGYYSLSPTTNYLSWNAIAHASAYRLYRDGDLITTTGGMPGVQAPLSYNDTDVVLDTTYVYTVIAVGEFEDSPESNEVSLTPAIDLSAPTVSVCQPCCERAARVTWTQIPNVTAYQIYRNGEPVSIISGASARRYLDTAVDVGTTYEYSVASQFEESTGDESAPVNITIRGWQVRGACAPGIPEPACNWQTTIPPANGWTTAGCTCED